MRHTIILLIFFFVNIASGELPSSFTLKSINSTITGPENGKIVSATGSGFLVRCDIVKNQLLIRNYDSSNKLLSQENYELVISDVVAVASNMGGNIKYFFDFDSNTFYHGQVNVLLEQGCVITKTSIGKIIY